MKHTLPPSWKLPRLRSLSRRILSVLGFWLGLYLAMSAVAQTTTLPAPPVTIPSLDTTRLLSPPSKPTTKPRSRTKLKVVNVPASRKPPVAKPTLPPNPVATLNAAVSTKTTVGREIVIEPAAAVAPNSPGESEVPVIFVDRSSGRKITVAPGQGILIEDPRSVAQPATAQSVTIPAAAIPKLNEKLLYPLPMAVPITSPFGIRVHPLTGTQEFHQGVDLGAIADTPVLAAFSGQVLTAGPMGGLGNAVVLAHGNFQRTRYGHLSRVTVTAGQAIRQGSVIGYVGSTGESTGPHLHFELWQRIASSGWIAVDSADQLRVAVAQLPR